MCGAHADLRSYTWSGAECVDQMTNNPERAEHAFHGLIPQIPFFEQDVVIPKDADILLLERLFLMVSLLVADIIPDLTDRRFTNTSPIH